MTHKEMRDKFKVGDLVIVIRPEIYQNADIGSTAAVVDYQSGYSGFLQVIWIAVIPKPGRVASQKDGGYGPDMFELTNHK